MEDIMQRNVSCIVCGSEKNTELYDSTFEGSLEDASEHFLSHRKKVAHGRITRCDGCSFVYTSPQFSPKEYDLIYQMAPKELDDSHDMQIARKSRFSRLAKIIRKHVEAGPYLDFGCGTGAFLDVMNDNRGIGFEVGQSGSRQSVNGHTIITGNLFQLEGQEPFTSEAFSYITSFDVFEHLPDLPLYIESLRRLIKADGHIILTVPNVESIVAKLTGERWNMILLEHLWYFSPQTFKRLMERHGFEHVWTSDMPYAAPLSHLCNRFTQTYGLSHFSLPKWVSSLVLPVPIGLMVSVFRRV